MKVQLKKLYYMQDECCKMLNNFNMRAFLVT
jgi:hypothetical protein